jgi:hypothetical protein
MSSFTSIRPYGDRSPTTSGIIHDPVAGSQINWNSSRKLATVNKLPPLEQRHGCWQTESGHSSMTWPPAEPSGGAVQGASANNPTPASTIPAVVSRRPKPEREDLGTTTILGVEARGQRWVHTTPVGEIGNDQPLVSTTENWTSTEFGFLVRQLQDDPQSGTRTRELVSLTRAEPDPSTFQPPEGYEVVTEEMVPCKTSPGISAVVGATSAP